MAELFFSISRFWLLLMGICCAYQLGYTLLSLIRTPRWKPGRQDGKPVRVFYSVPVEFRLDK